MNRVFVIIILFVSIKTFGQDTEKENLFTKPASVVYFNDKYKIGFYLGLNHSNYQLTTKNVSQSIYKDSLNSISKTNQIGGLDFGIYLENRLANRLALRSKATMLGDGANITYNKSTGSEKLDVFNLSVALSMHLVAQTKGEKSRLYFVLGPSILFGVGSNEKLKSKYHSKQFDVAAEAGIGYYIKFNKLFISPELKFSRGLLNINGENQTLYAQTINSVYRQNITFALTFSGH